MQETELKLSLTQPDVASLKQQLDGWTPCAGTQSLHNVYFDTPDHFLHRRRIALRIRQRPHANAVQWIQTLKIGGGDSALSQRGEWEVNVAGPELVYAALQQTPWPQFDPDGAVFASLRPCFETRFERTTWLMDVSGSVVEVALDLGAVHAGDAVHPIAELECELRSGSVEALFALAEKLTFDNALLPASWSKAQRGFGLAHQTISIARRRQDDRSAPVNQRLYSLLQDAFAQLITNLNILLWVESEEVLRQCWLGLRRWRAAYQVYLSQQPNAPQRMSVWQESGKQIYGLLRMHQEQAAYQLTLDTMRRPEAGRELLQTSRWLVLGQ